MATKHEWDYPGKPLKKGDKGAAVKYAQEWLCLNGTGCAIDGEFGPATEAAVKKFQITECIAPSRIICGATWGCLTDEIAYILNPSITEPYNTNTLSNAICAYAHHHLIEHPREVGGQNRGPWVRLYTGGKEGAAWPWCAAFVTYVIKQAAAACNVKSPIPGSLSCDELAKQAYPKARLFPQGKTAGYAISAGDLFLIPKPGGGYQHTGIVTAVEPGKGTFWTIEGNTNDDGSREGYKVCKRVRLISKCAFIKMS